jgi:protein-S-isoprenylcysteine O-methyltransferase Ste14
LALGACSRPTHYVPLLLGILLLIWPGFARSALDTRFLPPWNILFWSGTVAMLAGLLFTVAARRHLGGNWSGTVTLKQGHTLTHTGPYRFVRHPIYTGWLVAIFGSGVIASGEWRGVVALPLITAAFMRKIPIEEEFPQEHFGDSYRCYRQEVLPWLLNGRRDTDRRIRTNRV